MKDLNDLSTLESSEDVYRIREICEQIIDLIVNYDKSIRQCSDELLMPRSTIHEYIHTYIKIYYNDEYQSVKRHLKQHSSNY